MSFWLAATGGGIAGILHVLLGPDHLAAVLPFAVSMPRDSLRVGLFWGVGHGLGVVILGLVFLAAREFIDVEAVSGSAEILVGFLLVGLGVWAIRKSRNVVLHTHAHDHDQGEGHAHPHVHVDDPTVADPAHAREGRHEAHHHSTLGFGFIHGLAGMGHLVAASPLVALEPSAAVTYLAAYLGGGVLAMSAFAFIAGSLIRRPAWVPRGLLATGSLSIVIGLVWVGTFALA